MAAPKISGSDLPSNYPSVQNQVADLVDVNTGHRDDPSVHPEAGAVAGKVAETVGDGTWQLIDTPEGGGVGAREEVLFSADRLLTWDSLTGTGQNLHNHATDEGTHNWEVLSGTWTRETFGTQESDGGSGIYLATLNLLTPDVQASVDMRPSSMGRARLAARVIDNTNYLEIRPTGSSTILYKVEDGVYTLLAQNTSLTNPDGRHVNLEVLTKVDRVLVKVDGALAFIHVLSSGDQTTFGSATKHGLINFAANTPRHRNFVVRSTA